MLRLFGQLEFVLTAQWGKVGQKSFWRDIFESRGAPVGAMVFVDEDSSHAFEKFRFRDAALAHAKLHLKAFCQG